MPGYDAGILAPFDSLGVIVTEIYSIAINYYMNRTPLYSRFPHLPVGSAQFKIVNNKFRPTILNVTAAVATGVTTIVLTDASMLMDGDVLESPGTGEQVLVTAMPTGGNTITVTRGYAGTSGAGSIAAGPIDLIGNTRTGAQTEAMGVSQITTPMIQNLQTMQHPVQVGGALDSMYDYALPPGIATVFGLQRLKAMQETADDYERSAYYGGGVALASSTTRPQMIGLRALLQTNNQQAPTDAGAYTPDSLVRDTINPITVNGGDPDLMICSPDFQRGLQIWGFPAQRIMAGTNVFGMPIDVFEVPFLDGINLVFAPLLRSGTAICLTSAEVRNRMKRPMFDKPRGSRGDANESDIIMEGAIEPDNEHHHAWISGITTFAHP